MKTEFEHLRQRGNIILDLLPYIIGAAVVAGLLYGAYRWVDDTWQTTAGITEGKRLEHDVMQPKLDSCNVDLGDANTKLATQSASIAAAASAAQAQAANAKKLADDARKANAGVVTEIQRLGTVIAQGTQTGTCPAGAALAKVREGLR